MFLKIIVLLNMSIVEFVVYKERRCMVENITFGVKEGLFILWAYTIILVDFKK